MYTKIKVMLNAFSDTFKDIFANFYTIKVEIFKTKRKSQSQSENMLVQKLAINILCKQFVHCALFNFNLIF